MVHYQSIDVDKTHAANRSLDNDRLINQRNTNQPPIRRIASDETLLQPANSPRGVHTSDNDLMGSNEHRSYDHIVRPVIPRPSSKKYLIYDNLLIIFSVDGTVKRQGSSFDNIRIIEDNPDPSNRTGGNRSPYDNEPRHEHRPRPGTRVRESIEF
jgi:hypothetical protein